MGLHVGGHRHLEASRWANMRVDIATWRPPCGLTRGWTSPPGGLHVGLHAGGHRHLEASMWAYMRVDIATWRPPCG